ncbi:MAG: hypothetical protein IJO32_00520 [Bacilli bacterium]|nr:hypothetical protein [Bacilli bacterium]
MNKYIIPTIITFLIGIYLTWLITDINISKKYREELNVCKGMNNTYVEEINIRDEIINKLEQGKENE